MKKLFYIIIIVLFPFSSCKDYLEEFPKTEAAAESFFATYDGAFQGVSNLYARLGSEGNGIFGAERFMMPSIIRQGPVEMKQFSWTSSTASISSLWRKHYAFIAQANILIQNIERERENIDQSFRSSTIESGNVKRIYSEDESFSAADMLLGEVRFLRAFAYFTLYRYFGGVPLITEPTGINPSYVPRADREEVFNFLTEEFEFALDKCLENTSGLAYGRITKGTAAGMLAKSHVFHASYIRRAEMFGSQIGESAEGNRQNLYSMAKTLCDDIISGKYGDYELVEFYPAIFTKVNKEILFSVPAEPGVGTGNYIPFGFTGSGVHGAAGGHHLTSVLPQLYDIPTWEYESRFKNYYKQFGEIDIFLTEDRIAPQDSLIHLFDKLGYYSLTGDTTRRMWNAVKGTVTGPRDGGTPAGLWIFEPMGRSAGEGFFIEPGQQTYSSTEEQVIERVLEPHERDWWRNRTVNDRDVWRVNWHHLGKFRNLNPQDLNENFNENFPGADYPVLRLAEIYLLKAEAQLFMNDKVGAINTLNTLRDRASHQSTIRDLTLDQGDASYTYIPNSVMPIPTDINEHQALKELIYERLRELAGEDDVGWFDGARFPDVFIEDLDDISRYFDPLQGMTWFTDPNQGMYIFNEFNANDMHHVLLPIPATELTFFPEMRQNPGY